MCSDCFILNDVVSTASVIVLLAWLRTVGAHNLLRMSDATDGSMGVGTEVEA